MKSEIGTLYKSIVTLLVLILPACMYSFTPLSAQTDENSNSASQDYQEFQSCLSGAEVDGYVSEPQIRDCFAPIYNTGTATTGSAPSDTSSGGEDASSSPTTSDENDADDNDENGN
ncbi:MAG: hypothetical protein WA461_11635 [Nitrososphaeraceae archaeon]